MEQVDQALAMIKSKRLKDADYCHGDNHKFTAIHMAVNKMQQGIEGFDSIVDAIIRAHPKSAQLLKNTPKIEDSGSDPALTNKESLRSESSKKSKSSNSRAKIR